MKSALLRFPSGFPSPFAAVLLVLGAAWGWVACGPATSATGTAPLATTTSYLEAVARDLLGDDVPVLRLAEPGTCPGHFDLRPGQAQALRHCRALLRFDFQKALDVRFIGPEGTGPALVEVSVSGGLGVPANYLAACRQVADRLVALGWLNHEQAASRLEAVAARLDALTHRLTNQVAQSGLVGFPVLTSQHQREFCEWLGLRVVGTFRAADTAGIREIEATWSAGRAGAARGVIANRPEGTRAAEALAARLGVPVIVFDNFPALRDGRVCFDQMLADNVRALQTLARP